jgi:excisionase family DNA binding protein
MTIKKDYLTVKELADILHISRIAVFNKIKNGLIKAEKVGKTYIISKSNLKGILGDKLDEKSKRGIEKGVGRVVKEYGETLKRLGKE